MTRKRVHWGQTPFRVNDDPEISQLDAKYDPELGQSDPVICQFDWFPGHRWHGMEFGPNGSFSGSWLTRVFLECKTITLSHSYCYTHTSFKSNEKRTNVYIIRILKMFLKYVGFSLNKESSFRLVQIVHRSHSIFWWHECLLMPTNLHGW